MRIFIADDSAIVRRGIKSILSIESTWTVCGEAADGATTIERARDLRPDLLLLDVSLPDINGLEIATSLRVELPSTKILIISQHDSVQLLPAALAAGADGCVDKACLGTKLLSTIRNLRSNEASDPAPD